MKAFAAMFTPHALEMARGRCRARAAFDVTHVFFQPLGGEPSFAMRASGVAW